MFPKNILFFVLSSIVVIAIFVGYLSAGFALLCGLLIAVTLDNPYPSKSRRYAALMLKVAIVGMGFGLDISIVLETARSTFWVTFSTISIAMVTGTLLFLILKVNRDTGWLITSGTAICGGSAIAAVSQVINSRSENTAMAITVVFLLNLVGLYVFPQIGWFLQLTEHQFGVWAALAIHDTSSVVGAAADYGSEALTVATTSKLARALWIVPLTLIFSLTVKQSKRTIAIPLFIVLFVIASIVRSLLPSFEPIFSPIAVLSRVLLILALFLLGLGITRSMLRDISFKPMMMAILLWLVLSVSSLLMVIYWF